MVHYLTISLLTKRNDTVKPVLNGHSQKDQNWFSVQLSLNAGQKYGKCSKISNTLKLRTPKIIAENNF